MALGTQKKKKKHCLDIIFNLLSTSVLNNLKCELLLCVLKCSGKFFMYLNISILI